jgi:hypothetical protein
MTLLPTAKFPQCSYSLLDEIEHPVEVSGLIVST